LRLFFSFFFVFIDVVKVQKIKDIE